MAVVLFCEGLSINWTFGAMVLLYITQEITVGVTLMIIYAGAFKTEANLVMCNYIACHAIFSQYLIGHFVLCTVIQKRCIFQMCA